LRAAGYEDPVTLIGDEPGLPYERPPLSKALLTGDLQADQVVLRPRSFFAERAVELRAGRHVTAIDRERRSVTLDDGARLPYEHLVLATGARNRHPARLPGSDLDGVLALRTLAESLELRERLKDAARVAIVGAGFIGLEVASAAASLGCEIDVFEAAQRPMTRTASSPTAAFFSSVHQRRGVRLHLGAAPVAIAGSGSRVEAIVDASRKRHPADLVLVAVGVEPNDELAAGAGLAVDRGVIVDELLRCPADHAISAIGDCSRFPSRHFGAATTLESVQNAAEQGRAVALRIASGSQAPYAAVPWFWSDQAGLRLQIAGRTADAPQTIVCGEPGDARFSVLCFRDERLCGVESVGRPGDHVAARRLLAGADRGLTPREAAAAGFELRDYARAH
jgi:3-phenylpropionate/trans-cinnamate dioxygenase ferredoxin reductase subunit